MAKQIPRPMNKSVSLSSVILDPETFQLRGSQEVLEHHVEDLLGDLQAGRGPFDRLMLWDNPETGQLVLIQGHHRFEAYKRFGWTKKIPVEVYRCSEEKALLLAAQDNSKSVLPFTNQERQSAAWRLVVREAGSIAETAQATGISRSQVSNMRTVRNDLRKLGVDLPRSWNEALRTWKGIETAGADVDWEGAVYEERKAKFKDDHGAAIHHGTTYHEDATLDAIAEILGQRMCHRMAERNPELFPEMADEFDILLRVDDEEEGLRGDFEDEDDLEDIPL